MSPIVITPRRLGDERGWFSETYNARRLAEHGIANVFCQDNQSLTRTPGTLRGLHFQRPPHAQAKLVRCIAGRIFDVAVDIRRGSPTFSRWVGIELSADNGHQLFVPVGYAHGFLTLEPNAIRESSGATATSRSIGRTTVRRSSRPRTPLCPRSRRSMPCSTMTANP